MLTFEAAYATIPANGWLTEDEALLLWDTAKENEGPILEIGVYYGRSTVLLAALSRPVYAVDPFVGFDSDDPTGERTMLAFNENLTSRGIKNVRLFKQPIEDWEPRPCGFAYLDGDHTREGTARQVAAALACGVSLVCAHDYCNDGGGALVRDAIDACPRLRLLKHVGRMVSLEVILE